MNYISFNNQIIEISTPEALFDDEEWQEFIRSHSVDEVPILGITAGKYFFDVQGNIVSNTPRYNVHMGNGEIIKQMIWFQNSSSSTYLVVLHDNGAVRIIRDNRSKIEENYIAISEGVTKLCNGSAEKTNSKMDIIHFMLLNQNMDLMRATISSQLSISDGDEGTEDVTYEQFGFNIKIKNIYDVNIIGMLIVDAEENIYLMEQYGTYAVKFDKRFLSDIVDAQYFYAINSLVFLLADGTVNYHNLGYMFTLPKENQKLKFSPYILPSKEFINQVYCGQDVIITLDDNQNVALTIPLYDEDFRFVDHMWKFFEDNLLPKGLRLEDNFYTGADSRFSRIKRARDS